MVLVLPMSGHELSPTVVPYDPLVRMRLDTYMCLLFVEQDEEQDAAVKAAFDRKSILP